MPSHRPHPLRHVHFRVTQSEYQFLVETARRHEDTVASVLRGLIRHARHAQSTVGTGGSARSTDGPGEPRRQSLVTKKGTS